MIPSMLHHYQTFKLSYRNLIVLSWIDHIWFVIFSVWISTSYYDDLHWRTKQVTIPSKDANVQSKIIDHCRQNLIEYVYYNTRQTSLPNAMTVEFKNVACFVCATLVVLKKKRVVEILTTRKQLLVHRYRR